ncbi:MAG: glycoside hydrolase family 20 zincin-like fold domain-containing protein, partial [Planctomycetota bacterium]
MNNKILPGIFLIILTFSSILIAEDIFIRQESKGPYNIVAPQLGVSPIIDGNINEPVWKAAAKVSGFWIMGENKLAEKQTAAWITYSNDTLYLAFAVEDDDIIGSKFLRDENMNWKNDSIEIFLSPERDARKEKQFIIGVGGSVWDGCRALGKTKSGVDWNAEWQAAVDKTPYGYSVEAAIPFKSLFDAGKYPVSRGDVWYIKMTRTDKRKKSIIRSSFSPIGAVTRDILNVGKLIFDNKNILENADFKELNHAGRPKGWDISNMGKPEAPDKYEILNTPDGNIFKMKYDYSNDACYRIFPGTIQKFPVKHANTKYRYSVDIKWETKSNKKTLYFIGDLNRSIPVKADGKWHHYELDQFVWKDKAVKQLHIQGAKNAGTLYFKNVSFKIIEDAESIPSDMLCLTNNAKGFDTKGTCSYFDARTTSPWFPIYCPSMKKHGESKMYAGDLPIAKSILCDSNTATGIHYSHHQIGHTGVDVIYDLKKEYEIAQIKIINNWPTVRDANVFLKSENEKIYTLAASTYDRIRINKEGLQYDFKKGEAIKSIKLKGSARYVRIQLLENIVSYGATELQIWGKPVSGEKVKKTAYQQNKGKINNNISETIFDYSGSPPILPEPQIMKVNSGAMSLSADTSICYFGSDPRTKRTAEVLKEELFNEFSIGLNILNLKEDRNIPENSILLVKNAEGDTAGKIKSKTKYPWQIEQGYSIEISGNKTIIEGGGDKGLLFGCMSLLQLVQAKGDGFAVNNTSILDWPVSQYRMATVNSASSKGFLRAFARYKYTHIIYKITKVHTAIKNEETANDYLIEQTFLFDPRQIKMFVKNPKKYVEWDEKEDRSHINMVRANVCPSDPEMWKIYEEKISLWLPKLKGEFFSIGYDEMHQHSFGARWNVCPKCRKRNLTAGQLMADSVKKLDKIAKKYDKRILMCDTPFMRNFTLSREDDPDPYWNKALPLLPKDILFFNWHYAPEKPAVAERLKSHGFDQVFYAISAPNDWKDLQRYFSGIMWSMGDDAFSPVKVLSGAIGCWSPDKNHPTSVMGSKLVEKNLLKWAALDSNKSLPSLIADKENFFQIDLRKQANRSYIDKKAYDGKGWLDMGPGFDLQALKPGRKNMGGIPFDIIDGTKNNDKACIMLNNRYYRDKTLAEAVEIPVNIKAKSLIFLHCLDNRPGQDYMRRQELAGFYFMVFEDGTFDTYDIKYRVNAANWDGIASNTTYGAKVEVLRSARRVWEGDIEAGGKAHLYAAEWVNPKPAKKIVKILFRTRQTPTAMNPILLAVSGVKAGNNSGPGKEPKLPSAEVLTIQKPKGKLLDLRGGENTSEELYVAPNGIKITAEINNKINDTGSNDARWY